MYKILFSVLIIALLSSPAAGALKTVDEDIVGLIEDNKLDEAESILTLKIAADRNDLPAISLLGETYRRKGERSKALKYLQEATILKPSYPDTHLYLGKLYFTLQNFDKSVEEFNAFRGLMKPFVANENDKAFYLRGLHEISILYSGFKMYDKFYDVIQEILELSPQDQTATYNMGMYYYMYERNRPKAYEYFKKTVDIKPSSEISAKAKYAIEYMRNNPDPRVEPDMSFIDQEYRD